MGGPRAHPALVGEMAGGVKGFVSLGIFSTKLPPVRCDDTGTAFTLSAWVPQGHQWRLWSLAIWTTGPTPGTCQVYIGQADQPPQIGELDCESSNGNKDRADGVNSVTWMLSGERMMVAWAGQNQGSLCHAKLVWEDFAQTELSVDSTLSSYGR
jgi:hypothetical protein